MVMAGMSACHKYSFRPGRIVRLHVVKKVKQACFHVLWKMMSSMRGERFSEEEHLARMGLQYCLLLQVLAVAAVLISNKQTVPLTHLLNLASCLQDSPPFKFLQVSLRESCFL